MAKLFQLSLQSFTRLRCIGRDGEQIPRLTIVSALCKAVGGLCLGNHEHTRRVLAGVSFPLERAGLSLRLVRRNHSRDKTEYSAFKPCSEQEEASWRLIYI